MQTALDLRYNIAAICIAIIREDIATSEQAFAALEESFRLNLYTNEDILDMARLKEQGLTYKEIGETYGITEHMVYYNLSRKKDLPSGNLERSS